MHRKKTDYYQIFSENTSKNTSIIIKAESPVFSGDIDGCDLANIPFSVVTLED